MAMPRDVSKHVSSTFHLLRDRKHIGQPPMLIRRSFAEVSFSIQCRFAADCSPWERDFARSEIETHLLRFLKILESLPRSRAKRFTYRMRACPTSASTTAEAATFSFPFAIFTIILQN